MGVELTGLDTVQKHLASMEAQLRDKSEFKSEGALLIIAATQDAFRGNPLGWLPNDPETIRRKGHSQIGVGRTGKMSATIEPIIGADYVASRYRQYYGRFFEKRRPMAFTANALKAFHDLNIKIHSWKSTRT